MLKKFFLVVCGSFVGTVLALTFVIFASIFTSFAIFGSMAGSKGGSVKKNSILYLNLDGELVERARPANPFASYAPSSLRGGGTQIPLATVVAALDKAKDNDDIKGVYIDCRGIAGAPASLLELREALVDFKQSKKFVYAFGDDGISQGDYYLASVADSIFLNPEGLVDIHGVASVSPYFKTLLDKVGVEMQVIRVGTFKSAVEPYMLDSISPANRLQQEHYLGSIWNEMANAMASSRKITAQQLNTLADSIVALKPAQEVKAAKLVDALCYRQEFEDKLRRLTDVADDEDLKLVAPSDLVDDADVKGSGSDKVAVLFAVGEIDGGGGVPGSGEEGIDSEDLADQIRKLRLDKDVKALVLRVNSPGGSAFGSEVIWKALDDFKASGKPFAVSMGDYAASGGYYISSGAQQIFAEPTTITGSIGIFGMVPCVKGVVEDKLGVHMSVVKTNANSDFGSITQPLTPYQREAMQQMVNRGYELFTSRCAQGRNVTQDSIKAIAEGRVWDGKTALKIGLVDQMGGIDAAVKWVADKAKLKKDKYKVVYTPTADDSMMAFLEQMQSMRLRNEMRQQMGLFYDYYELLHRVMHRDRVLCIMEPVTLQ